MTKGRKDREKKGGGGHTLEKHKPKEYFGGKRNGGGEPMTSHSQKASYAVT